MYLVDEEKIRKFHDRAVSRGGDAARHVKLINASLKAIDEIARLNEDNDPHYLAFVRLALRSFNSAAAALLLARSGYFQQAFSLARDLMETGLLMDFLQRNPDEIPVWNNASENELKNRFGPAAIRKALDEADGYSHRNRETIYKQLSKYASHPTPQSFQVISPNGLTKIGPFPDSERLTAVLSDIAKFVGHVATILDSHVTSDDEQIVMAKQELDHEVKGWLAFVRSRFESAASRSTEG